MTKKEWIRMIAFALVVCMLLVVMCDLFENERTKNSDSRFYSYRKYNEDTIDAVFIGTSGVDRYWCGPKAYEKYGMTVYPLSTDGMPAWLYTDVLDYALMYQNPQLVMLDIRAFCQDNTMDTWNTKTMDAKARRFLDALPWFSPQWFKVAFKSMRVIHEVDESNPRFDISLLLSYIRFHEKWESAGFDFFYKNLGNMKNKYCGFYMADELSAVISPQELFTYDPEATQPLDPLSQQALMEIIEYVQDKGLQLLFVDTPQFADEHEMNRANYIYGLLEEMGIDYVTSYTTEGDSPFNVDLDPKTDFYNASHVNFFGAEKYTDFLAAYLHKNYDLPDRRYDPAVREHWDGVYQRIRNTIDYFIAHPVATNGSEDEEA